MKRLLIALAALTLMSCGGEEKKSAVVEKYPLKVLYVGGSHDYDSFSISKDVNKDSLVQVRYNAFMSYLENHFTESKGVMAGDYTEDMSAAYDVTIFDGAPKPKNDGGSVELYDGRKFYSKSRTLSETFSHPAIFIADAGENNGRAIGVKIDWY